VIVPDQGVSFVAASVRCPRRLNWVRATVIPSMNFKVSATTAPARL